jgi:hypothetical protein
VVRESVKRYQAARPVEVSARFPRTGRPEQRTLLVEVYAQREGSAGAQPVRRALRRRIEARLRERFPEVTPLVSVTVLEAPPPALLPP